LLATTRKYVKANSTSSSSSGDSSNSSGDESGPDGEAAKPERPPKSKAKAKSRAQPKELTPLQAARAKAKAAAQHAREMKDELKGERDAKAEVEAKYSLLREKFRKWRHAHKSEPLAQAFEAIPNAKSKENKDPTSLQGAGVGVHRARGTPHIHQIASSQRSRVHGSTSA
jgi:hypothetical protein